MSNIATISLRVNTTELERGNRELERFQDTATAAAGKADDLNSTFRTGVDNQKKNSESLKQQRQELQNLLNKISPVNKALDELDSIQESLAKYRGKGLVDDEDFTRYNSVLETTRTKLAQVMEAETAEGRARIEQAQAAQRAGGVKNSSIAVIQNSLAQVTSRRSQTATNGGNSASIDRIDTTIADTSEAVSRALVTLDASAGGNVSNSTDLTETLANFTQASAIKINSLTVTVNGQTAAINQTSQAVADVNGNLSAMYNIKVAVDSNGRQYAAGMGIGVENTPSGMQSQVLFMADRFAVMAQAGGTVTLPFVIQNGQTIIRDTVIGDGTISNAKIGNYIQSNNYVAGSAGWKLDKGGTFEINGVAGGGRMLISSTLLRIYDSNNVLRVRMGLW